ncbi:hypothetical protein Tco_1411327, partial [Tanacetum coccineum]
DPEGDILLLEAILSSEPLPPLLPNHEQYMPEVRKELKLYEAKTVEPSVHEPPKVELKELPPHLEYAFLEGDKQVARYQPGILLSSLHLAANERVFDLPLLHGFATALVILITEVSQTREHESCKSPTAELFEVDSGRISIRHLLAQP